MSIGDAEKLKPGITPGMGVIVGFTPRVLTANVVPRALIAVKLHPFAS